MTLRFDKVGCDTDIVENDKLLWDGEMFEKDMLDIEMPVDDVLLAVVVVVVSLGLTLMGYPPFTPAGELASSLRFSYVRRYSRST